MPISRSLSAAMVRAVCSTCTCARSVSSEAMRPTPARLTKYRAAAARRHHLSERTLCMATSGSVSEGGRCCSRPSEPRPHTRERHACGDLAGSDHGPRARYSGVNHTHLAELLTKREGVTLFPLHRAAAPRAGHGSPPTPMQTAAPPVLRQRMPQEGDAAQLDGSHHAWLEDRGPG